MITEMNINEMMDTNGGDWGDIPGAVKEAFAGLYETCTTNKAFQKAVKNTFKITAAGALLIVNPLTGERAAYNIEMGWSELKEAAKMAGENYYGN